jgi:DNA-binding NtrC family response regulator
MTYRDTKTAASRAQVQLRFAKRAAKAMSTFQCLVVSADKERGPMLQQAAAEGGWNACVCVDTATALAHVSRSFVHLALVDLEGRTLQEFRPVLEQLASQSGVLLIVCGNEGSVEEELWVRQRGAWLYLPGVVEASNLALLCGEAKQIVERLARTAVPAVLTPASEQSTYFSGFRRG